MSTQFDGALFKQLSPLAVWSKTGGFVIKHIAGSNKNVIQKFASAFPRMTMQIAGTAAQMAALQAKVGTEGSLIFHFETATARLLSMEPPVSIGIDNDLYFSALLFVRSSGDFSSGASGGTAWLTEGGDSWLTEGGDAWLLE